MGRRQLRPLREVATTAHEVTLQPLSSGDPDIATRVKDRYTDPGTEVGAVGHALNILLDHVSEALAARHRSEQQVRQFVGDASHELRTPLATIHGYAELARRTPDDPGALSAALSKVETEADRMAGLVEDLLLLARLESGRPLDRADVDITRLLLEFLADARVVAPTHRWQLDLPDEPVTVTGDEQRLHQVLTNLLGNARHHAPARHNGDRLRVRGRRASPGRGARRRPRTGSGPDAQRLRTLHAGRHLARPRLRWRRSRAVTRGRDRPGPRRPRDRRVCTREHDLHRRPHADRLSLRASGPEFPAATRTGSPAALRD